MKSAQASSANTRVKQNDVSVEIYEMCQLILPIVQRQQKKDRIINVINYFEL